MEVELVDRVYEENISKPGAKVWVAWEVPATCAPAAPADAGARQTQGPACWFDPELRQFVDRVFKKSGLGARPFPAGCLALPAAAVLPAPNPGRP